MKHMQIIIVCFFLTILISMPMLIRISSVMPFLSGDVRRAAPQAITMLREQGIWLVNATFDHAERKDGDICFVWNNAYQSRWIHEASSLVSTCIHEEK